MTQTMYAHVNKSTTTTTKSYLQQLKKKDTQILNAEFGNIKKEIIPKL
jgi:hypothetical protein